MSEFKDQLKIFMKSVTWEKDSHSLFDYEIAKNSVQDQFQIQISQKFVNVYRKPFNKQVRSEIIIEEMNKLGEKINDKYQLLCCFQVIIQSAKIYLKFYHASQVNRNKQGNEQNKTQVSFEAGSQKQEDTYLIVRSLKTKTNQNKGYKLNAGQIIKIGRMEFYISEINNQKASKETINKSKFWQFQKTAVVNKIYDVNAQCRICMLTAGSADQPQKFLCSPCKCSGSCGVMHFECLALWNQSKVKKDVIGQTLQYNFDNFHCQVCHDQYPKKIIKDEIVHELMPIQKVEGDHLILQGINEKTNNMIVIKNNIPLEGITIGRGHECQIKIADISVSRKHARIEKVDKDYILYDNKSKFGTLVKENYLQLELSSIKKGVQIGRTVLTFQTGKKLKDQI